MLSRTAFSFRAHGQLVRHILGISRQAPLSITAFRRKDEDPPKNPMEKRDTDTKPYTAEYTRSGRNDDVAQKKTAYDPDKTDPKQEKREVKREENGKDDKGSLDVSPAEEEVSKDRDRSREEISSTRHRGDPSNFVKTPNHELESEGDLSESNTGREKYKQLRHDKSEEPYYHKP